MTPQQRSRENLTARGYLVGTVEHRKEFPDKNKRPCAVCGHQPRISVSVDLWNCFDLIALEPGPRDQSLCHPVTFVQTTTRTNHAARRNKILASMEAKLVLLSGARILLQSWFQDQSRGRWQCKDDYISLSQFKQAPNYPDTVAGLVEIKRKAKKPDLPPGTSLNFCEGSVAKEGEIPF